LPQNELLALEDAPSYYSVGWSCGKEKFLGKPDFSKGSFYANPLMDSVTDDQALIKQCETKTTATAERRALKIMAMTRSGKPEAVGTYPAPSSASTPTH